MLTHSTAVLAYMAGLIDGEGTICIFPYYGKHAKYPLGYRRYKPLVSVTNTNRLMIEWVVEHFGGVVRTVKRYRQEVIAAKIKELNRTGDPHAVAVQGRDPIH